MTSLLLTARTALQVVRGRLPAWAPWAAAGTGSAVVLWLMYRHRRSIMAVGEEAVQAALAELEGLLRQHGIDTRWIKALASVESGGRAASKDGRPIIRFEPGIWKGKLAWPLGPPRDLTPVTSTHQNQAAEYAALDQAKRIDAEAAYRSISMGMFQVMGFNHQAAGYKSAVAMFQAFVDGGQTEQLKAQVRFIINYANGVLLKALKAGDIEQFARRYNGDQSGAYAAKLRAAFARVA